MEDFGEQIGEDCREKLRTTIRVCEREEKLIKSLLAFSRVDRTELSIGPVGRNGRAERTGREGAGAHLSYVERKCGRQSVSGASSGGRLRSCQGRRDFFRFGDKRGKVRR